MMWNWFSKLIGKRSGPQRRRVAVDIPFEQHSYRKTNVKLQRRASVSEKDKGSN